MSQSAGDVLKDGIVLEVRDFVTKYPSAAGISTRWGTPLVGFAHAAHPYVHSLKTLIGSAHALPTDVLADASIVVAYYIPFTRELAEMNAKTKRTAAPEWALAYEQTNAMFGFLSAHLIEHLESMNYRAAVAKETSTFDRKRLVSNWSHRHFAYAAGLGTFGLNNMLITRSGCCGRYFTLVTNLDVEPDAPQSEELCLFKKNGSCGVCVKNCPVGALSASGYERHTCYALCSENARIHTGFGSSYTYERDADENASDHGSAVCGKCITASPCAFRGLK